MNSFHVPSNPRQAVGTAALVQWSAGPTAKVVPRVTQGKALSLGHHLCQDSTVSSEKAAAFLKNSRSCAE